MKEQRQYPRAALRLPVIYDHSNKGQSKDISQRGICLLTNENINHNKPFEIEIQLEKGLNFKATSKIQWNLSISPNLYKTGIEFQSFNKDYERILVEFLLKHLEVTTERREAYRMLIDVVVNYSIQAKAKSKNINSKGICLFTREPLEEGKIQQLKINLNQEQTVQAFAKVIWNQRLKTDIYENGLTFWDIDESNLLLLNNFLQH